jgi:hypothetical protein
VAGFEIEHGVGDVTSGTAVGRRGRLVALIAGIAAVTMLMPAAHADAALTVQDLEHGVTPADMAQSIAGSGVTISNVTYAGAPRGAGTFLGGSGIIGFDNGMILNSGKVQTVAGDPECSRGVEGPNNCYENGGPDGSSNSTSFDTPGDPDLSTLSGFETFDASILEFDFVPEGSAAQFSYVFSSEEYSDYSNSSFNDVFAFLVNGSNCATVPGTGEPVSINTINNGNDVGGDPTPHNPQFFIDNVRPAPSLDTQMDGLTTVLTCNATVNPGQTNHMKLAIADASDSSLDSAVFLQQGSLTSPASVLALELSGRKKQKPIGPQLKPAGKQKNENRKLLSVKVTCLNDPCQATVKGKAKAPGASVKLENQQLSLQAGETRKLRLSATSRKALAELKAELKDGEKGKATIKAVATDPAGATVRDKFKVKLRG